MKCFYEVLEVSRDVEVEDLKKSYKKLALRWHPDKNPNNIEEAKEQFQLIQQAYEVLSDPRERKWYDNHREYIINSNSDTPVDEINLFKYFSPSCYKGFADDEKGFYTVYREVFSNILIEENSYFEIDSDEIPTFGQSNSDYSEIVRPFYNFWCNFSTHKPFGWLDEYDIRQAPNRRVAKLMEKENKKIRDKAKKERNDEIQALVEFVRKRDKRVKAYAETVKQKSAENVKRMEEARRKRIKEKQIELSNYKESEWTKFSNVEEELKVIEESLIAEYGESDYEESNDETVDCLYCVACNKVFKTEKAFQNHENSKKHKENIEIIKAEMLNDELIINSDSNEGKKSSDINDVSHSSDDDQHHSNAESSSKSNAENSCDDENCDNFSSSDDSENSVESENNKVEFNKKKSKKNVHLNVPVDVDSDVLEADLSSEDDNIADSKRKVCKKKKKQSSNVKEFNVLYCLSCDQSFKTEKALFNHRTSKKHQENVVLISAKQTNGDDQESVCDNIVNNNAETEKEDVVTTHEDPSVDGPSRVSEKLVKNKKKLKLVDNTKVKRSNHACGVCASVFSSKNKLHQHLKDSNHAVLKVVNEHKSKRKGKNN
ncbi:dnaJ homolog subfamily C member 21 [Adelges cooleyi]|uniref:dnaJ homolog subfamily C member 21 n=1 Tax=Adelges cooleyi TaxID=133065 RepID=UPI00217F2935|nr:dnaJ homolog subfamily C member 21 [Adelges cooleyi]XP_050443238.1 dnaJ homolog subfamily C member 21 [Adelges cooleyi]